MNLSSSRLCQANRTQNKGSRKTEQLPGRCHRAEKEHEGDIYTNRS